MEVGDDGHTKSAVQSCASSTSTRFLHHLQIYLTNTRLHAIKSIEPDCSAALALKAK